MIIIRPKTDLTHRPNASVNHTAESQFCRKFTNNSVYVMLLGLCLLCACTYGQGYEDLNELKASKIKTYFSAGAAVKAERMARQLDKVLAFYDNHLRFVPSVTLLVLSEKDWRNHTTFPVYGMPHYTDDNLLIVASEDNSFWKSMIPPLDNMSPEQRNTFIKTYTNAKGELTMEPFFDLLTIHELGHAYHIQGGLTMQRRWMGELFCNILLHTYIAENEPAQLDALTGFPEMVEATTKRSSLKYTTLEELEANYNAIGANHPQNYGWFQCRWHMAAATIYDQSKLKGIKNLWRELKQQKEKLDDAAFIELLREKVHESVAEVPLKWDQLD